jgi:hypothetical protein
LFHVANVVFTQNRFDLNWVRMVAGLRPITQNRFYLKWVKKR